MDEQSRYNYAQKAVRAVRDQSGNSEKGNAGLTEPPVLKWS